MTLEEKQQEMVEDYLLIEDRMERFSILIGRKSTLPPLEDKDRLEEALVPGCNSRVWLVGHPEDGLCRFQVESDSPMIGALAALLCELHDGHPPEAVAAFENTLVEDLRIADQITPTRRRGLSNITGRIRQLAAQWV